MAPHGPSNVASVLLGVENSTSMLVPGRALNASRCQDAGWFATAADDDAILASAAPWIRKKTVQPFSPPMAQQSRHHYHCCRRGPSIYVSAQVFRRRLTNFLKLVPTIPTHSNCALRIINHTKLLTFFPLFFVSSACFISYMYFTKNRNWRIALISRQIAYFLIHPASKTREWSNRMLQRSIQIWQ